MTVIEVAIVEDEREIRQGLSELLSGAPGYRCADAFATMEDAIESIRRKAPHVLLADIGLPGMSGIEGVRRLREIRPELPVLMLTVYEDDERIFEALCAGACGYFLKNTPPERLLAGIGEVLEGGAPMSPEVARRVIELFRRVRPPRKAEY